MAAALLEGTIAQLMYFFAQAGALGAIQKAGGHQAAGGY